MGNHHVQSIPLVLLGVTPLLPTCYNKHTFTYVFTMELILVDAWNTLFTEGGVDTNITAMLEAVAAAKSLGITSYHFNQQKRDYNALKAFLKKHI